MLRGNFGVYWPLSVARNLGLLLLCLLGCSGPDGPARISGVVTYNGKPLTGGNLTFVHAKGITGAPIGKDGKYLITDVPPGPMKIGVEVKNVEYPAPMGKKLVSGQPKPVQIPKVFADAEKSGLTYTAKSGSQTHDINLDDGPRK